MSTTTVAAPTQLPTGTWDIDAAHSRVEFQVKHLGISNVRGHFARFGGTLELGEGPASARAYGTVETESVNTNDEGRAQHLRSADFFAAEQFPEIAFVSKSITPTGDDTFEITGELTLRGVTREVKLQAELSGTQTDPWGGDRVGVEVTGQLDRRDYGITFNQALGGGNVLVSDKVKLHLDLEAVKRS